MSSLRTPLATGEFYHIFNQAQNKEPVFARKSDSKRAMASLDYYRFADPPVKLSYFLSYGADKRSKIVGELNRSEKIVEVLTFCLMPNHFHLLIKQLKDGGISHYLSLFQNSFTKYRNTKYQREGHLFSGQFKAVRIEDDDQLLHVHRYIHLNPYTGFVVKSFDSLENYYYSSLPEYLGIEKGFCHREEVLAHFKDLTMYRKFIFNQANYQRKLNLIKHLVFE